MENKGFTLIELLAVIVILAIIALIAVPIILNIIGSSKNSSVVRSGELYLKAVETAIARKNLNGQFNPTSCIIGTDGNLTCTDKDNNKTEVIVEVNGSKPTGGIIILEKGKITEVTGMILDGFELEKKLGGKLKIKGTSSEETSNVKLNPQGTHLQTGSSFSNNIEKDKIETITVINSTNIPSNAIDSWDATETQDGSVMVWYTDIDSNELYELYIGGEGGVKANPDSSYLFSEYPTVKKIDVSYLYTNDVTNMESMFDSNENLTTIVGLNNFDTSQVANMNGLFYDCVSLTSIDVSSFDTSNVEDMEYMFENCKSLTNLDVSKFNTSKVTTMLSMFAGCSNLLSLDVSNFDIGNVKVLDYMFGGCTNLTNLNISSFEFNFLGNLKTMFHMFDNCSNLEILDMRKATFDGSNSSINNNGKGMFIGCDKLKIVYVINKTMAEFINLEKENVAVVVS